jgi:5-methylcytosine-specific restriction endonuclease McrA
LAESDLGNQKGEAVPDKDVKTIRELIFYQYAKIIAKRALASGNAAEAKRRHYGFIRSTFRDLRDGVKTWSEITREDWQLVESERECVYCGSNVNLNREHIVPKSLRIKSECATCDAIQSIHNQVLACSECNRLKATRGLYEFYKERFPGNPKFYDRIPPLVEKKYLKTIFSCHECAGTLEASDPNGNGVISVADIDFIIRSAGRSA